MAKQKKYFVSIACKRPVNFEATVKAKSQQEALDKVLEMFDDGMDNFNEEYCGDTELDIKDNATPKTNGVWIEEK